MNPRLPKSVLLPLAAGLVQILSGCLSSTSIDPDRSAGGSDEIDTRIAVDRTGRPVVGARIALVRTDDSTGKPVALSATGKDGSFPSFVVPDGFYSVMLRDVGDSLGKYVDSLQVKNQKAPAGRDTLLALGSLRGVVKVSAGHSPTTVTVGLLGTDILANVKADGTFRIDLVPGGLYTLGAFPSLDGYGPLYKRIQLKDGQNLTLTDTLVLPFTGLPSPGGLRVLQDTGTGNVRVSWNRVDHPDLLGYVLERVESGSVTFSRYLTDTSWTDSLGPYWEAMPLLGPWPLREVAYRVRSRSLSGSPDSKSVAQAFTAKAPEWTKRVDSVKVTMATDSVTEVTKLKWNSPSHPDLVGWTVSRNENGKVDCSNTVYSQSWDESGCRPLDRIAIDSSIVLFEGSKVHLNQFKANLFEYSISTIRKNQRVDRFSAGSKDYRNQKIVQWNDLGLWPTSLCSNCTRLSKVGNWIVQFGYIGNSFASKDGVDWEEIPTTKDGKSWRLTGLGDSLWMIRVDPDSSLLWISTRIGNGLWRDRSLVMPFPIQGDVAEPTIQDGKLTFWAAESGAEYTNTNYYQYFVDGEQISHLYWGMNWTVGAFSVDALSDSAVLYYAAAGPRSYLLKEGEKVALVASDWVGGEAGYISAIGNAGGQIFVWRPKGGNHSDYQPAAYISGPDAWIIPFPSAKPISSAQTAYFNDEIWTIVDGHLWKGKLNLPIMEKP